MANNEMCDWFDFDNVFLLIMTGICGLIVVIDCKVLEKMFEEHFNMTHYLTADAYEHCYKPQSMMRLAMECYAVYSAILSTLLTGSLALNLPDSWINWMAKKIVNFSFLVFGPLLFTLCVYGFIHIKELAAVCGMHGILPKQFNGVCIFLLMVVTAISVSISYCLATQKSLDVAEHAFTNENSCLYRISQMYFQYQQRLREQRSRYRRRDREERDRDRQEQ